MGADRPASKISMFAVQSRRDGSADGDAVAVVVADGLDDDVAVVGLADGVCDGAIVADVVAVGDAAGPSRSEWKMTRA